MITLIPERWVRQAMCVRQPINPDAYHASKQTPRREVEAALALCAVCPVRADCLQNALDNNDMWGIWGGTTEEERAVMLRAKAEREAYREDRMRRLYALRKLQRQAIIDLAVSGRTFTVDDVVAMA